VEHEISLFVGKNPFLGMLKTWESLAAFLQSIRGFRETFILRNILVMFPLEYRKSKILLGSLLTGRSTQSENRYWNSLKTI
jgi:hypothetical protein